MPSTRKKSKTEEGFEDRNVCFLAIAVFFSAIAIRDRSQSANKLSLRNKETKEIRHDAHI